MGRAYRLGALVLLCASLAVLAAACGGSSGSNDSQVANIDDGSAQDAANTSADTTGSTTDDPEDALLEFTQCMRDNGVDVPDPTFDSNGRPQFQQGGGGQQLDQNDPDVQAAMEKCQQYLQGAFGQFSPEDQEERQQQLLDFAQCLRDNGIDVEDPDFSQTPGQGGGGGGLFGGLDLNDPDVQAAMETCQDKLGDIGPPGGAPGQGGDNQGGDQG